MGCWTFDILMRARACYFLIVFPQHQVINSIQWATVVAVDYFLDLIMSSQAIGFERIRKSLMTKLQETDSTRILRDQQNPKTDSHVFFLNLLCVQVVSMDKHSFYSTMNFRCDSWGSFLYILLLLDYLLYILESNPIVNKYSVPFCSPNYYYSSSFITNCA
jgi:hypothetical protein